MASTKAPRLVKHRPADLVSRGLMVFDDTPITFNENGAGFILKARGVSFIGSPTLDQWTNAMRFAGAAEESSPYWIGDLLRYAESRDEWREKLDQAVAVTGLARSTLHDLGWISRQVEPPEREIAQTITHAKAVAPLARPDQTHWLERSRTEDWTARELRRNIEATKRKKIIDLGRCQRCNSQDASRVVQTWHLSVGDCHERPILCDSCAGMVAQAVRAALQPITKVV